MNRNKVKDLIDELLEKIAFYRKEQIIIVEPSLQFNLKKKIEEAEDKILKLREVLKNNPSSNFDSVVLEDLSSFLQSEHGYKDFDKAISQFIEKIEIYVENSKNVALNNKFNNKGDVHIGDIYLNKTDEKLDSETIIKELKFASSSIKNEKYQFHNLPNSQIEREETKKLLDFISEKSSTKTIAFLTGEAGMGKTFITRDLYHSIADKNIPCLAIKADRKKESSIENLRNSLGLSHSFMTMFEALADYDTLVLIIDQIDALSQTLSNDRKPLETYTELIDSLQNIPNIKIVVSCREYDLAYDTQLQKYQNRQQYAQIKVEKLKKEQVIQTLSLLKINASSLNPKFIEFLSTPLHLDVFCRVYKPHHNLLKPTLTLQNLYDELWQDKINDKSASLGLSKKEIIQLLKGVSNEMYKKQTLTLKKRKYKDAVESLKFLTTENLIVEVSDRDIQFFHQTFFDYVFARFFVESEKSLSDDLENNIQGLFTRSRVKQVINYLKYYDEELYETEVRKILSNDKIRFHIKLIIIELFSFYEDVLIEEKQIFNDVISKDSLLLDKFLNKVKSSRWIEFLFENHTELIIKNKKNAEFLIAYLTRINAEKAITIVEKYYKEPSYNLIFRIIYNIEDFSKPRIFSFIEKNILELRKDKYLYKELIDKISQYNKEWIFGELYNFYSAGGYADDKLIDKLSNTDLEMSYYYFKKIINKHIANDIIDIFKKNYLYDETMNNHGIYNFYPYGKEKKIMTVYLIQC